MMRLILIMQVTPDASEYLLKNREYLLKSNLRQLGNGF